MASAQPAVSSNPPVNQFDWSTSELKEQSLIVDDQELAQVHRQLQTFVSRHEESSSDYTEGSTVITRLHWVNSSKRPKCNNRNCKLKFSLTKRKHHCRKCGEVFCAKCLQYQRRLSPAAEYDPNGRLYMVCLPCFNSETQERGQARIWTGTFAQMRKDSLASHAQSISETISKPTRSHLLKECERLVDGFAKNPTRRNSESNQNKTPTGAEDKKKSGGFFKRLGSFKNQVSKVPSKLKPGVPQWQKPDTWVLEGPKCQFCRTDFTYKKHNCYVCGRLVCKSCSSKDLLLYVPDKRNQEQEGKHARWAIIRIIGSPEIEPDKRMYIRVCTVCRDGLESLQVDKYRENGTSEDNQEDCMTRLTKIHGNIVQFQDKIDEWLPKYKQLIDSLEIAEYSPSSLPPSRNNMQVLAKNQGDLADYFTSFVVAVSRLKQLKPRTHTELKLVKSLMSSKFTYYSDNMYTFRKLKKRLEQISPPEVLQAIQSIVDSQAMNSACLSVGQLAYESLHICLKYELSKELPMLFKDTYEVCQADLKKIIEEQGEKWEEHQKQVTAFIKMQLKGGEGDLAPCLYLRPSRRSVQQYGTSYVDSYLCSRCEEITGKILLQLQTRCAYRQFQKTKDSLVWLRESIANLRVVMKKPSVPS